MISAEKINQAKDVLGINHEEEIDERKVVDSFIDSFTNAKTEKQKSDVIGAKIALTLHIDEERHKSSNAFLIPIKNYCRKCSSKGYIPEREITYVKTQCPDCDGTGVKTVPCKKCNNSGYVEGEVCSVCKGTGKYRLYKTKDRPKDYLCGRCQGTKQIYEVQSGPNILDFEVCSKCKGAGFNINFPAVKKPEAKDLGGIISQKMEKVKMKPIFGQMAEAIQKAKSEKKTVLENHTDHE